MKYVLICLLVINALALMLYGIDKRRAKKNRWRISEAVLQSVAFFGGSFGALLGMHLFRHKTNHRKFKILVPLLLFLNAAVFAVLCMVL